MKKRFLLALLPFFCLSSCGEETYTGKYKFMLGKEADPTTQVGIGMELTDQDYSYKTFYRLITSVNTKADLDAYSKTSLNDKDVIKVKADETKGDAIQYYQFVKATNSFENKGSERPFDPEKTIVVDKAKKFNFTVSIGNGLGKLPDDLALAVEAGIAGSFSRTEYSDEKYGTRLAMSTVMTEDGICGIEHLYNYIAKETAQEVADLIRYFLEGYLGDEVMTISPEFLNYLFTAYLTTKQLTIKIPVSVEDFQQQLVWYGRYFDLTPEVKENIRSIKDVMKNFKEILLGMKFSDLREKTTMIIDEKTNKYVKGEKIVMPGKEGEARFGTLPNKEKDSKTNYNDIDLINYYFGSEFSNTFAFNNSTDKVKKGMISKWITIENNIPVEHYYYYDASQGDWTITPATTSIDATMYTQSFFGEFNTAKDVRIDFVDGAFDKYLGVRINRVVDKETNQNISFEDFYQTPFTFRSPNTLPLTLSK